MHTGIHGSSTNVTEDYQFNYKHFMYFCNPCKIKFAISLLHKLRKPADFQSILKENWCLITDAITVQEEADLISELTIKLKTLPWNDNHFDDAILNYREFMISDPLEFPKLESLFKMKFMKLIDTSVEKPTRLLPYHVLELGASGSVKPHIDNINVPFRFNFSLRFSYHRV